MSLKIANIFLTKNKKQFTKPYLRTDQPIQPILGRILPSLLDEACDRHPNHRAFNQWQTNAWQSQSNRELRTAGEELALGLLEEQLRKDDKVALLMHSDRNFLLTDFASSLAGLVTVPIDLTQTLDNIVWILNHSAARVLVVSDTDLLAQVIPYLEATPNLQAVMVADILTQSSEFGVRNSELSNTSKAEPTCLYIPMLLCQAAPNLPCPELPQCIHLLSFEEVRARGQKLWSEVRMQELRSQISPQDLATIVYIPGETGQPKGVMLSHENITANILTTFKSITGLKLGAGETVLSFLPLTHIFARAFIFGHLNYGHSIYFSTPNRAARDFLTVRPTIVATVPRLLEKIAQKIGDRRLKLQGIKRVVFDWAWQLANNYELGKPQTLSFKLQLKLADGLVFAQVRKSFGGRLRYFISGGAALKADLANTLSAAGMTVLQGYGLTETSSVICCNQDGFNRGGTVGLPIPGVEIAIAPDQEILVKSPYVMQGYYQDPEATKAVIDDQGWLHTGDLGAFTPEGFLTITGNKKNLFKLATGKYVTPQPLEEQVKRSPLVAQAVVVGMHKKFCGMLIFADVKQLRQQVKTLAGDLPDTELLLHPQVIALYQTLVDEANEQLPRWSKVQQFQLLNAPLTVANGLLNPSLQVNRAKVNEVFAREIEALYEFGIRPKGFLKDDAKLVVYHTASRDAPANPLGHEVSPLGHIAPLRSASSSEFKGLVKKLRKLKLAEFQDLLGYWRHRSRSDHSDIPFIGEEGNLSTPNSFQIPFVERAEDL
jgi:long-chain acyl-CoA synthetase